MAKARANKHAWEAEVGTPSHLVFTKHVTAKSLETRALKGLLDLMELGRVYNHQLQDDAAVAVQEIRDTHLPSLPIGQWKEWRVTDTHSGLTQVVRFRRTA